MTSVVSREAMRLSAADFEPGAGFSPAALSARYDPERPFLFDGLAPRYQIRTERSIFVPMRDGVGLSTDLHLPLGAPLPLPVVLIRTCYGKSLSLGALQAVLPEQGFVCAIQDVRGRHESEGVFVAGTGQDRDDGWDTLEWLAAQSWCSGAIGTMGSSYLGETAAKIAAMRHPAHKCGIVMFDGSYAGGNSQNGAYLQGGITLLRMLFGWFRDHVPKASYGPPGHVDRQAWFRSGAGDAYATEPARQPEVDAEAQLRTLPVYDMLDRTGAAPSDFADYMRHAADPASPYWRAQRFLDDADRFHTPTLHVTGPLERGGSGFDNFRLFRENAITDEARDHQYLWFTPAMHSRYSACQAETMAGARSLGDTRFPYHRAMIDWFDHWLRGSSSEVQRWPKVRYFPLNLNQWLTTDAWPPPDATQLTLYLHGEGSLSRQAPVNEEAKRSFVYDPMNPVPSEPPATELDLLGGGYADRAVIENREDVLVYTAPAFAEPLHLAGPVSATFYVSSTVPDTDLSIVLTEVDDEGHSINITHGMSRLRYREGRDRQVMMQPDTIYPVVVDLWHVAIVVPVGHRLRVEVTSSHFPVFDRNLNTGGDNFTDIDWQVATNTIHHAPAYPSSLTLLMRPADAGS